MVTVSWEAHDVWPGSDGSCDGVLVAIWKDASGGWTGGYVDYCPQSVSSYTWAIENIVNGYGGPGSGAQVGFFTMSTDCSLRSSVSFTTWP